MLKALRAAQTLFPFPLKGIDFDNDGAFMNKPVVAWCRAQDLEVTRSRAYPEERPSLGGAKEWGHRPPHRRLRQVRGHGSRCGAGERFTPRCGCRPTCSNPPSSCAERRTSVPKSFSTGMCRQHRPGRHWRRNESMPRVSCASSICKVAAIRWSPCPRSARRRPIWERGSIAEELRRQLMGCPLLSTSPPPSPERSGTANARRFIAALTDASSRSRRACRCSNLITSRSRHGLMLSPR